MAAGIINLQKASGGITKISGIDGTGVTELVVPESGELVNKDYADLKVALADFTGGNQSLNASGYQKLPGGLIIQWGSVINTTFRQVAIAFPIAFPNTSLNGSITTSNGTVVTENGGSVYFMSKTGMAASLNTTYSFYWFAIGY